MTSRDRELLNRWKTRGDATAFDSLVTAYAGLVYAACKRILRDDAAAEDATQECFLQLAYKTPTIETSLGAWLHTVATRRSISLVRQKARRRTREDHYARAQDSSAECKWTDIQEFVDEALVTLPNDLREPIIASFLERKSHAEIADEVGVDRSTISRRIDKGIEKIREYLKKKGAIITAASLSTLLADNAITAAPKSLTATLAKIALVGEEASIAGIATGGGLAGMSIGKIATGTIVSIAILSGIWTFQSSREKSDPSPDSFALSADAFDTLNATESRIPEFEFDDAPDATASVTDQDSEMPQGAETETVSASTATPIEEDDEEEPEPEFTIAGRVYDDSSKKGLEDVGIAVYQGSETGRKLQATNTGSNGLFSFAALEPGQYRFTVEPPQGYVGHGKRDLSIQTEIVDSTVELDVPLTLGGVLEGVAMHGTEPITDTTLLVTLNSASGDAQSLATATDSLGQYRIESLSAFSGSIKATARAGDRSQESLNQPVTIEHGKVSVIDFDFIGGTASMEGHVYRRTQDNPLQSTLRFYFKWVQDGHYREDVVNVRTGVDGYYFAEGLPAAKAEIHVFPNDPNGGGVQKVETVQLEEGLHLVNDINVASLLLSVSVTNIPPGSKELFVFAHEGEATVLLDNVPNMLKARNTMIGLSQNRLTGEEPGEYRAMLKGLEPGRYTITASTMPIAYNLAAAQGYGYEKLFQDMRTASTFVTIEEGDQQVEIQIKLPSN